MIKDLDILLATNSIKNNLELLLNNNFAYLYAFYINFDLSYLHFNASSENDVIRNILYYLYNQYIEIRTKDFILTLFPLINIIDCFITEEKLINKELVKLSRLYVNYFLEFLNEDFLDKYFIKINFKNLTKSFNLLDFSNADIKKEYLINPLDFWRSSFAIINNFKVGNKEFLIGLDNITETLYIGVY
jgi:hypothetical protein